MREVRAMRGLGMSALVGVAAAVAGACSARAADPDEAAMPALERVRADGAIVLSAEERAALGVETVHVEVAALAPSALRVGRVVARPSDVGLVVAGVAGRVTALPTAETGAQIAAGDTLVTLVPVLATSDAIATRVQALAIEGQLASAQKELALARATAARLEGLGTAASAQARDEARAARAKAEAEVAALQRERQATAAAGGTELAATVLTAPIAGRLATLETSVGAVVQPGEVLARVVADGPRWVEVAVAPAEPPGAGYEIAWAGAWRAATFASEGVEVGADGLRHDRLTLGADAPALLPGAALAVRVVPAGAAADARGPVVPEAALVPIVGGDAVFVVTPDGAFVETPVVVRATRAGRVRVEGLGADAEVVTRGAMGLRGEVLRARLSAD